MSDDEWKSATLALLRSIDAALRGGATSRPACPHTADPEQPDLSARSGGARRDPCGYAYFLRCPKCRLIKIGWSKDVGARAAQVQCPCGFHHEYEILGYLPGGVREEQRMHRRYSFAREQGEWFRLDDAQVADVVEMCQHRGWVTPP